MSDETLYQQRARLQRELGDIERLIDADKARKREVERAKLSARVVCLRCQGAGRVRTSVMHDADDPDGYGKCPPCACWGWVWALKWRGRDQHPHLTHELAELDTRGGSR